MAVTSQTVPPDLARALMQRDLQSQIQQMRQRNQLNAIAAPAQLTGMVTNPSTGQLESKGMINVQTGTPQNPYEAQAQMAQQGSIFSELLQLLQAGRAAPMPTSSPAAQSGKH